jgi:glycolate oxidase FAD binding subunit
VIPRGGGTKMGWGNPPARAELVLSTARMNRVLEHAWADLTVTVEAGCTVQQLQQTLAQHGQMLAIDPLWPERATVGGILATNDSGTLRVRFGGLRDLIIGVTVVLTDGTIAHSGGKVVKNVAGYDLQKLMTGALGTLGVMTEAVFRLYPSPRETRSLTFAVRDYAEMQRLMIAIQDSTLEHTGLQARIDSDGIAIDVRFSGTPAGLEARTSHAKALAGGAEPQTTDASAWLARESLFAPGTNAATCKFSVLPAAMQQFCAAIDDQCFEFSVQRHLACPREFKKTFDVWGSTGDTSPLMRRVKQQFDPGGILNPGRFVGGI